MPKGKGGASRQCSTSKFNLETQPARTEHLGTSVTCKTMTWDSGCVLSIPGRTSLIPRPVSIRDELQADYQLACVCTSHTHAGVVRAYDEAWQLDKANCHKYFH